MYFFKDNEKRFIRLVSLSLILLFNVSWAFGQIPLNGEEQGHIASGQVVVREIKQKARPGRTFEAIGYIRAPQQQILNVLTGYEHYPEFMPNVSRVDVQQIDTNRAQVEYTLSLPMGKQKQYRLLLEKSDAGIDALKLSWKLIPWPELKAEETIRDTTGFWLIQQENQALSKVLYHVYTDAGPVPFGLGWIVDILSKKSVPQAFINTRQRSESQYNPAPENNSEPGEKNGIHQ